jgi:hypothetical protein
MTSTTCRENKARTEVPEECCENGGLGALDDDRRYTFMTRSPVRVRFYRSTTENWHENKNPAHESNPVFNGRFHEKVIKSTPKVFDLLIREAECQIAEIKRRVVN